MPRIRATIGGLMGAIAAIGLGAAALRQASPPWAAGAFTVTLAVLGAAPFGVIYRRGGRRAFWLGFTSFGWGYLILAFAPWFATEVRPRLVTSALLEALDAQIHPGPGDGLDASWMMTGVAPAPKGRRGLSDSLFIPVQAGQGMSPTGADLGLYVTRGSLRWPRGVSDSYLRVGHSLAALVAAMVGGLAAWGFHATRREGPDPAGPRPRPVSP